MKKKTIIPDVKFVAIGKTFISKQRAEERSTNLLSQGYIKTFDNGKRMTFKK